MRTIKIMLAVNGVTLGMNSIIVWLTIVKAFPPVLGIALFVGCLTGLVWLSCRINGLPAKKFHAAKTEPVRRLRI